MSAIDDGELLHVVEDSVLALTLNRPARLNALTWLMLRPSRETLDDATADPSVRADVLRGAGRAVCSGGDIRSKPDSDDSTAARGRAGADRRGRGGRLSEFKDC